MNTSQWEDYFTNETKSENKEILLNQTGRGLGYNRKGNQVFMQRGKGSLVKPTMISAAAQGLNMAQSQVKNVKKGVKRLTQNTHKGSPRKKRKSSHGSGKKKIKGKKKKTKSTHKSTPAKKRKSKKKKAKDIFP